MGHVVNVSRPWSNGSAPVVIQIGGNALHGAADPRRGRYVFGR
jgi:gamma-glutamyltranspeptidase